MTGEIETSVRKGNVELVEARSARAGGTREVPRATRAVRKSPPPPCPVPPSTKYTRHLGVSCIKVLGTSWRTDLSSCFSITITAAWSRYYRSSRLGRCAPRSQTHILDEQVALETRQDALHRELMDIKYRLNAARLPIRLPPEIMADILLFVRDDLFRTVDEQADRSPKQYLDARKLWSGAIAVCRRWRQVATATPALWRRIDILQKPVSLSLLPSPGRRPSPCRTHVIFANLIPRQSTPALRRTG